MGLNVPQENQPSGAKLEHVHHGVTLENGTCLCRDFDHLHRHDDEQVRPEEQPQQEECKAEAEEMHRERQLRIRCEYHRKHAAQQFRKQYNSQEHLAPAILAVVVLASATGGALIAVVITRLSKVRTREIERQVAFEQHRLEAQQDETNAETAAAEVPNDVSSGSQIRPAKSAPDDVTSGSDVSPAESELNDVISGSVRGPVPDGKKTKSSRGSVKVHKNRSLGKQKHI